MLNISMLETSELGTHIPEDGYPPYIIISFPTPIVDLLSLRTGILL